MKLIKITFLLAVVSIIVSLSISQAYATPPSMVVVAELKANHTVKKTQMVTKNTYTEMQYKNNKNFTAITDPCPDCKIGTEVYGDNDNKMGTTITTVMGHHNKKIIKFSLYIIIVERGKYEEKTFNC